MHVDQIADFVLVQHLQHLDLDNFLQKACFLVGVRRPDYPVILGVLLAANLGPIAPVCRSRQRVFFAFRPSVAAVQVTVLSDVKADEDIGQTELHTVASIDQISETLAILSTWRVQVRI